jgi:hypothetical protein
MTTALDLLLTSTIVTLAVAFLAQRFVRPGNKGVVSAGDVVVGASLQRGLDKARSRQAPRHTSRHS